MKRNIYEGSIFWIEEHDDGYYEMVFDGRACVSIDPESVTSFLLDIVDLYKSMGKKRIEQMEKENNGEIENGSFRW